MEVKPLIYQKRGRGGGRECRHALKGQTNQQWRLVEPRPTATRLTGWLRHRRNNLQQLSVRWTSEAKACAKLGSRLNAAVHIWGQPDKMVKAAQLVEKVKGCRKMRTQQQVWKCTVEKEVGWAHFFQRYKCQRQLETWTRSSRDHIPKQRQKTTGYQHNKNVFYIPLYTGRFIYLSIKLLTHICWVSCISLIFPLKQCLKYSCL